MKLSRQDRADLCRLCVITGVAFIVSGIGLPELVGQAAPLGLRSSLATFGVLLFLAGLTRLNQAATGRVPFKEDTRVDLFQFNDADRHRPK